MQYSRWIFVAGILTSIALYAYEWQRAIRVIRKGGIADSYLDRLACQTQSMRGKGWKRFLVFAELTKSKKGADYVALFVYFQFSSAWRIIFAEAGRQVVNAFTLYSVLQANLIPVGKHAASKGTSDFVQFWDNIGILFNQDREQGIVLFTMLFTLVIFVFSALSLIVALVLYLVFLWHYIPESDGRLSNYCKRKIDKRLEKFVGAKVLAPEGQHTDKMFKDTEKAGLRRQPTLPELVFTQEKKEFGLVRENTQPSLHSMSSVSSFSQSRSSTPREPTLPAIQPDRVRPGFPRRTATDGSSATYSAKSYDSDAPLLPNADSMGYSTPSYPRHPMDRSGSGQYQSGRVPPLRTMAASPQVMQRQRPSNSASNNYPPHRGPPLRSNTGFSFANGGEELQTRQGSPAPNEVAELPTGPPSFFIQSPSTLDGRDSSTRTVSHTSFNRPFPRNDRPSVHSVAASSTMSVSSYGSSMVPAPLRQQGSFEQNQSYASQGLMPYSNGNATATSPMSVSSSYSSHSPLKRNMSSPLNPMPLRTLQGLQHGIQHGNQQRMMPPVQPVRSATDPMQIRR